MKTESQKDTDQIIAQGELLGTKITSAFERLSLERDNAREYAKELRVREKTLEGALVTARDKLSATEIDNTRLREALALVITTIDKARLAPKSGCGVGGQTIESNIKGSVYNGVDAWPIEEARDALFLSPFYDEVREVGE